MELKENIKPDRPFSVISLGGKKRSRLQEKDNYSQRVAINPGLELHKIIYTNRLTKPIYIRYIDPKIVPLLVELGKLTKMVKCIASNSVEEVPQQKKEELQLLIKSTKQISEKVETIMQENSVLFSQNIEEATSQPERVDSEYRYMPNEEDKINDKQGDKSNIECVPEDIDIGDLVSRVQQRIAQLEAQNKKLGSSLEQEKEKGKKLIEENQLLKLKMQAKQKQTKLIFQQLKQEMVGLTKSNQNLSEKLAKINVLLQ